MAFLSVFHSKSVLYVAFAWARRALHRPVWGVSAPTAVSAASIAEKVQGAAVKKGEVIGRMGERHENGNWFPHTHFQLSLLEPVIADMPGVVFKGHRATALRVYPDPRLVLGPLW